MKSPGSLLVYRTDVVMQNSAVIYKEKTDTTDFTHILYDISFGISESQKFIQYYKSSPNNKPDDFCRNLLTSYESIFNSDASSFAYDLSYVPAQPTETLTSMEQLGKRRMEAIIQDNTDSETIRHNALCNIVPAAARVFESIRSNSALPGPISVQIELTNKCSTECTHCFRWANSTVPDKSGGNDGDPHMHAGMALQILDELKELGTRTVTLSGGEPTQHPDFIQILEHASQNKLSVGVLSNGVGLSDDVMSAIIRNACWLRLSVDGSAAAVYNRVRRPILGEKTLDPFSEVENTIKRYVRYWQEGSQSCKLAICYTIQAANVDDVPQMIRWVGRMDVPNADESLIFKFAHGRGEFLCKEEQIDALYERVLNHKDYKDAANLRYLRSVLDRISNKYDIIRGRPTEELYLHSATRCYTPYTFMLIDPHGDVYPCCFLFEDNRAYSQNDLVKRREHVLGSVRDGTPLKKIWEGKKYEQLRTELVVIEPTSKKFASCGECTRHCNHNRALSLLHAEYSGLARHGNADKVLSEAASAGNGDEVWL